MAGGAAGHQDLPAVGLDQLAVFYEGVECCWVDRDLQSSVGTVVEGDFVACRQHHIAQLRADHAFVDGLRAQQCHRAAVGRMDRSLIQNVSATALELGLAVHEVAVQRVERARHQAADIDFAAGSKHNTGGVDEPHLAVGIQLAVDSAGVAGADAVEGAGAGVGLDEVDAGVAADVEAVPVEHRPVAALRDVHPVAALADAGLSGADTTTFG